MRSLCSALVCLAATLGLPNWSAARDVDDEVKFPYRAFINADDVYLRSGPGQNYYPVRRLRQGEEVEVYRHDPGGWYAIRPTAECFSWIAAEFVEPGEGRMATIKGDRVVARVGSSFSEIRDVIQVRLDAGEVVEVLEARRIGTGAAAQTWYKILPPAGEFRWVSGKFIDHERPTHEARQHNPNNNMLIARQSRERTETEETTVHRRDRDNESYDVRRDEEDSRARHVRHRAERSSRDDEDEYRQADVPPSRVRRSPTSEAVSEARGDGNLLAQLEQIDMDLTAEVAKQPGQWDLRGVRSRTEAMLAKTEDPLDRGRIRLVQRKIARFEDIKQRSDSISTTQLATDLRNREVLQASLSGTTVSTTASSRFDGMGKLAQVQPSQAGVAGYALVDKEGRVTHYVTAAPGVNLRPFLGQEVAIQGTLGYMPDARTQHVTAKRVTTGDSTRLLR